MTQIWIASQTVGSGGAASVTFSNIPQTFTHLQLRCFTRTTENAGSGGMDIRLNGDSGSNYYRYHVLFGNGTSAASGAGGIQTSAQIGDFVGQTGLANTYCSLIVDFLDYRNTAKNKVIRSLYGFDLNGSGIVAMMSSMWISTAAINSIQVGPLTYASANLVQNSRFDLYGIQTASATGA